ncbi:MAG: hypothetical protein ACYCUX_05380 [Metallibacterium sp.]
MKPESPICRIIAGPNGAGKTTFALEYLPQVAGVAHFINADLIAAGLSPLAPERELLAASRIFLHELEARIGARESFAFETTLAGRGYLRLVDRLRGDGWRVELIYLALPSAEMSRLRVAERVWRTAATTFLWPISNVASRAACAICWTSSATAWIEAPAS